MAPLASCSDNQQVSSGRPLDQNLGSRPLHGGPAHPDIRVLPGRSFEGLVEKRGGTLFRRVCRIARDERVLGGPRGRLAPGAESAEGAAANGCLTEGEAHRRSPDVPAAHPQEDALVSGGERYVIPTYHDHGTHAAGRHDEAHRTQQHGRHLPRTAPRARRTPASAGSHDARPRQRPSPLLEDWIQSRRPLQPAALASCPPPFCEGLTAPRLAPGTMPGQGRSVPTSRRPTQERYGAGCAVG